MSLRKRHSPSTQKKSLHSKPFKICRSPWIVASHQYLSSPDHCSSLKTLIARVSRIILKGPPNNPAKSNLVIVAAGMISLCVTSLLASLIIHLIIFTSDLRPLGAWVVLGSSWLTVQWLFLVEYFVLKRLSKLKFKGKTESQEVSMLASAQADSARLPN